jgi:6-bladed beta-propeller
MKLPILFFLILLISCNSANQRKLIYKSTNPIIIQTNDSSQKMDLGQVMTGLSYIPISSNDTILVTQQNKIVHFGNKFYLADFKLAFLYLIDSNGRIIHKFGKIGLGKGDFPSIEGFNIDNYKKELLLYSLEKQSLIRYSLEGKYLGENKFPFFAYDFAIIDSIRLAFFMNQNKNEKSGTFNLLVTNREGKIIEHLFDWSHFLPYMMFSYTGSIRQGDSSTLLVQSFSDSIYKIARDTIYLNYRISFGNKTFPQTIKEKNLLGNVLNYSYLGKPIVESRKYLVCSYFEDRKIRTLFYNKFSKKTLTSDKINKNLFYSIFRTPLGEENDTFYSLIDIGNIHSMASQNIQIEKDLRQFDPKLYEVYKKTNSYSNPVIASFKFIF